MPTAPRLPGDQTYDRLLVQDGLPAGVCLLSRFPGARHYDNSRRIDAMLGYDDQTATDEDRQAGLNSKQNQTIDGNWRYIEHTARLRTSSSGSNVRLFAVPEDFRIPDVVYLPWRLDTPSPASPSSASCRWLVSKWRSASDSSP